MPVSSGHTRNSSRPTEAGAMNSSASFLSSFRRRLGGADRVDVVAVVMATFFRWGSAGRGGRGGLEGEEHALLGIEEGCGEPGAGQDAAGDGHAVLVERALQPRGRGEVRGQLAGQHRDRKSTRLNSSHVS